MNNETEKKDDIICENCNVIIIDNTEMIINNNIYCESCKDKLYTICSSCDDYTNVNGVRNTSNGDTICDSCYEDAYFTCEGCNEILYSNDNYCCDGYCNQCCSNHNNEDSNALDSFERSYSKNTNLFLSNKVGNIIKTKRIFSTEIECYYPDYNALENLAESIPDEVGLSPDGSLNNNGVEVITPKLSGQKGETLINSICDEMKYNTFTVNKSCGLHIHIDAGRKLIRASDIKSDENNPEKLKMLFLFYYIFDDVLLSFMPKSRRDNHYCMKLSKAYPDEDMYEKVLKCKTLSQFDELWYKDSDKRKIKDRKKNKYDNTRYAGVNFHSLLSNNHIEIRFHSGTTDKTKILYWIQLNCRILDRIIAGKITLSQITNLNLSKMSDKTKLFFNLIKVSKEIEAFYIERQCKFVLDIEDTENICVA